MRRRAALVVTGVLVSSLVVIHCGDDGSVPSPEVLDGSTDASNDGRVGSNDATTIDAAKLDGATSVDSSAPADAAPDAEADASDANADAGVTIPDGGAPPDPSAVKCGAESCAVATQFCCQQPDGGASCKSSGGDCSAVGGTKQDCNESADCPIIDGGRQVCCFEVTPSGLESSCHRDCNGAGGNRYQSCRTTTECQDGACEVRTCNGDAGFVTVQSCEPIPSLCP